MLYNSWIICRRNKNGFAHHFRVLVVFGLLILPRNVTDS